SPSHVSALGRRGEGRISCSAASMSRKKFAKCTMPAMWVSANSTRLVVRKGWDIPRLVKALAARAATRSSYILPVNFHRVLGHAVGVKALAHRLLSLPAQFLPPAGFIQ